MMKRILFAAALLAALPCSVSAQVEKRVEVTKAYVPSVESAAKLAVVPDMTDTVKMRPEIDYTITPLSLQTTLATRPIRPATVTYWEFNRPLPFYLKAGAGYPLNSVLDFYASSQNPGTGYVVGYVNHEGRYAKIKNDFGIRNNSTRMLNRIGAAAGKYFGKHILEGDLSYENRMYHRYGMYVAPDVTSDMAPGAMADYGDANIAVRFGDDFQDLSRVNFEIAIRGGLFFDHSEWPDYNDKARQTTLETHAKIARGFGRHRLAAEFGYTRLAGQKAIGLYNQQLIHGRPALRYRGRGSASRSGRRLLPRQGQDRRRGELHHSFRPAEPEPRNGRTLSLFRDGRQCGRQRLPLVDPAESLRRRSVLADQEFGRLQRPFRYRRQYLARKVRLQGVCRIFGPGQPSLLVCFRQLCDRRGKNGRRRSHAPGTGRQTVLSFNGEVTWRPVSSFRTELGVHGYIYNDDETKLHNGAPSFDGSLSAHYDGRKISFGAGVYLQSARKWSAVFENTGTETAPGEPVMQYDTFEAPFAVDLRVNFDWKVSGRVTLFAEGRNLINRRLYEYPFYPEYGANFTVGVKANF